MSEVVAQTGGGGGGIEGTEPDTGLGWALELTKRFQAQPVSEAQGQKIGELRAAAIAMAVEIVQQAPEGREMSLALTKLEESLMWAVKAVARGPA